MINYTKNGGKWLAKARGWIQRKFLNGEMVIWGSTEELRPVATPRMIEELAAQVAEVAYIDELIEDLADQIERDGKNSYDR